MKENLTFNEYLELNESLNTVMEYEMTDDSVVGKRAAFVFDFEGVEYGVTLTNTNWQNVWSIEAYQIAKSGTKLYWRVPNSKHLIPFLSTVMDVTKTMMKMWKGKVNGAFVKLPKKVKNVGKIEMFADRIIRKNHREWFRRVPVYTSNGDSTDSLFFIKKNKRVHDIFKSKKFKKYIFDNNMGDIIPRDALDNADSLLPKRLKASRNIIKSIGGIDVSYMTTNEGRLDDLTTEDISKVKPEVIDFTEDDGPIEVEKLHNIVSSETVDSIKKVKENGYTAIQSPNTLADLISIAYIMLSIPKDEKTTHQEVIDMFPSVSHFVLISYLGGPLQIQNDFLRELYISLRMYLESVIRESPQLYTLYHSPKTTKMDEFIKTGLVESDARYLPFTTFDNWDKVEGERIAQLLNEDNLRLRIAGMLDNEPDKIFDHKIVYKIFPFLKKYSVSDEDYNKMSNDAYILYDKIYSEYLNSGKAGGGYTVSTVTKNPNYDFDALLPEPEDMLEGSGGLYKIKKGDQIKPDKNFLLYEVDSDVHVKENTLHSEYKDFYEESLSEDERRAIKKYTGSFYGTWNRSLRSAYSKITGVEKDKTMSSYELDAIEVYNQELKSLLNKMRDKKVTDKSMVLFRATSLPKDIYDSISVNNDFIDPALWSTTLENNLDFSASPPKIKFAIYVPKGSLVIPALKNYSNNSNEVEVILPPMSIIRPVEIFESADGQAKSIKSVYVGTAYEDYLDKYQQLLVQLRESLDGKKLMEDEDNKDYDPKGKYGFDGYDPKSAKKAQELIRKGKMKAIYPKDKRNYPKR